MGEVTVAALFVERGGVYWDLPGVDPWDEARDARLYAGPHPVVAHPPCQLWTNFAALNFKRYGGEHNRPGNDDGRFAQALRHVRCWGGVLEHPAASLAWPEYGLPRPRFGYWWNGPEHDREYVTEVWQSAYGHKARKRTWLLYVGRGARPPGLDWRKEPGTHQVGWFDRIKPTLGKKEASATPPAFRDMLLLLARTTACARGYGWCELHHSRGLMCEPTARAGSAGAEEPKTLTSPPHHSRRERAR